MKKISTMLLVMLLVILPITGVNAMREDLKEAFVNSLVMQVDNPMAYTRSLDVFVDYLNHQVCPFVEDGTTYVPLRFLLEYQGGKIKWDNQKGQVVIYYSNQKYCLSDGTLRLDNQTIALQHPLIMRDDRYYVSVTEWNEKVLGKQLNLHENYIVLLPKDHEIPDGFWELMDKYFRDFTGKHGELELIFGSDKNLCGLADQNGNVIIEPKYEQLYYRVNRPIITQDRQTKIFTVMTEDEEILFQVDVEGVISFVWLWGEPNSFGQNLGGRLGENEPYNVYDIIGEEPSKRVGEFLGTFPCLSTYVNGLKVEIDSSGRSILKNRSGNILYSAMLPDHLGFPWLQQLAGSKISPIQEDCLLIYHKRERDVDVAGTGEVWGTLDLEGNLVPFAASE